MIKNLKNLTDEQVIKLTEILEEVWRGNKKMVDYSLKSAKYIYINGRFISCCTAKPSIDKTMWYDDEGKGIDTNFNSFVSYNKSNMPRLLDPDTSWYLDIAYWRQKGRDLLSVRGCTHWQEPEDGWEEMTEEEIKEINKAIQEVRDDYKKRLEMYYKKYSDKICARGYWVNR